MGVDKFSLFIELHQPWAMIPTAAQQKNNAFLRAARAGQAVIVDAMTHLHKIGPRMGYKNRADAQAKEKSLELDHKNHVTGDEFVSHFYSYLVSYFTHFVPQKEGECAWPVVLAFDKEEYMNPAKSVIRATRDKYSRAQEPYPDTARIEPGGIRVDPDSKEPPESIDIERLLHSRSMRHNLRRFLLSSLTREDSPVAWPDNTRIIVDCDDGVFAWRCHPQSGRLVRCDAHGVVLTEENKEWIMDLTPFRNTLGEADLAAVFWTRAYMTYMKPTAGVRVVSKDTDHAVLQTYHFWKELSDPNKSTFQIVWDNETNIQLYLRRFVASLKELNYARDTLVCVGILSKCDYFEKNVATKQVGHEELYRGIAAFMAHRKKLPKPQRSGSLANIETFGEMLRFIYAQKLKCKPTAEEISGTRKHKQMVTLLTNEELLGPFVQFKLAYAYWTGFRCWCVNPNTLKNLHGQLDAEVAIARMQEAAQKIKPRH